jgi:hypothetical protein
MINRYTIYGERCSGTNYLEMLITTNFDVSLTWDYGWKHFFGFNDLSDSDETLFICIIRDPVTWLNSLFQKRYHLYIPRNISVNKFLSTPIHSHNYRKNVSLGKEILQDRHIRTKKRYQNIFQLRYTKLNFMRKVLPNKVKHSIFIRYEDLLTDFTNTMIRLRNSGLRTKSNIEFPVNCDTYKKTKKPYVAQKYSSIPKHTIIHHPYFNAYCERGLDYLAN